MCLLTDVSSIARRVRCESAVLSRRSPAASAVAIAKSARNQIQNEALISSFPKTIQFSAGRPLAVRSGGDPGEGGQERDDGHDGRVEARVAEEDDVDERPVRDERDKQQARPGSRRENQAAEAQREQPAAR